MIGRGWMRESMESPSPSFWPVDLRMCVMPRQFLRFHPEDLRAQRTWTAKSINTATRGQLWTKSVSTWFNIPHPTSERPPPFIIAIIVTYCDNQLATPGTQLQMDTNWIQMGDSNNFATSPFALPFALVFAFLASCISISEIQWDQVRWPFGTHSWYCASFSHAFLDSPAMMRKCLTCHTFISFHLLMGRCIAQSWIQWMPGIAPNPFIIDPFSNLVSTWSTIRHRGCSSLGLLRSTESILVAHLDPAGPQVLPARGEREFCPGSC